MGTDFSKCKGVGASAMSIWEAEQGRIVFEIAKDAAIKCELDRGSPEQNPATSLAVGVLLLSPSIVLSGRLLLAMRGEQPWGTRVARTNAHL